MRPLKHGGIEVMSKNETVPPSLGATAVCCVADSNNGSLGTFALTHYDTVDDSSNCCCPSLSMCQFGVADPRAIYERVHEVAFTSGKKRMEVSHYCGNS